MCHYVKYVPWCKKCGTVHSNNFSTSESLCATAKNVTTIGRRAAWFGACNQIDPVTRTQTLYWEYCPKCSHVK
jgi:hypothetical protein